MAGVILGQVLSFAAVPCQIVQFPLLSALGHQLPMAHADSVVAVEIPIQGRLAALRLPVQRPYERHAFQCMKRVPRRRKGTFLRGVMTSVEEGRL